MDVLVEDESNEPFTEDEDDNIAKIKTLRKQYYRLHEARQQLEHSQKCVAGRPMTCFLHPSVTPCKLYEHLKSRGAADAVIVDWLRRLKDIRDPK